MKSKPTVSALILTDLNRHRETELVTPADSQIDLSSAARHSVAGCFATQPDELLKVEIGTGGYAPSFYDHSSTGLWLEILLESEFKSSSALKA